MLRIQVLIVLMLVAVSSAFAMPAQIVIIRHAEKPVDGNEVSSQGCERAYSLPSFFMNDSIVNSYGRPVAIYAMAPDNADGTLRPIQTIAPTAQVMGLESNASYGKQEGAAFAASVLDNPEYDGKTVLVSWEHQAIAGLAAELGVPDSQIPNHWPGDVFDQAWVISYTGSASLQIIPEYVLPTDNPQGGANWADGPQRPTSSSPVVSAEIQKECVNNNSLNAVARSVTVPSTILTTFPLSGQ